MTWKQTLEMLRRDGALQPLPESFIFGVATADHQVEAFDPDRKDVWDVWEGLRKLQPRLEATDFTRRYREDIELARRLGCKAFRFSIAWSRVEPEPGHYDDAVFDYYRDVVRTIRANGMEPMLTLLHFTWPVWLQERGGLIADDFPATFTAYAAEVAARLGADITYWITVNEPTQLVYGLIKPWWEANYALPPGLPPGASMDEQVQAVGKLMRNLFLAHSSARQAIRSAHPHAQVAANPLLLGLPVWLQRWIDRHASRVKTFADLARSEQRLTERMLLERGQADVVIATLTRTAERARQVLFSDIYFEAHPALLTRTFSPLERAADLKDKTVAVVTGSTGAADAAVLLPGATVRTVGDYDAALAELDAGRAAAVLGDDTILDGLIRQHPGKYEILDVALTTAPYAAAVAPGNADVLDVVDLALRDFKACGGWAASYATHFGGHAEPPDSSERAFPAAATGSNAWQGEGHSALLVRAATHAPGPSAAPLPLARAGSLLRRIQDRGFLIVAAKQDVPGFGYRDAQTGKWSGLEIDLARAVAAYIFGGDRSKVRFVPTTTRQRIPLLRSLLGFLDPLLRNFAILSSAMTSNWWHLGMAGKLATFLCPPECVGQQDFIGLDYYWGIPALRLDRIQRLIDSAMGRFDRAPVWPGALYGLLRYHAQLAPELPLLIVENGSVPEADGIDRSTYIRQHVREVQRAVASGVKVIGYLCWSITSNREWGLPFGAASDFGLYHIELDADPRLQREPTPAVAAYQEIIAQRGTI